MSTDNVRQLHTENTDAIASHNAAREFEDKLVALTNEAFDNGVYGTVIIGILNTTAFQVMQTVSGILDD